MRFLGVMAFSLGHSVRLDKKKPLQIVYPLTQKDRPVHSNTHPNFTFVVMAFINKCFIASLVALAISLVWTISIANPLSSTNYSDIINTLPPLPPNITHLKERNVIVADFAREFYNYHTTSRWNALAQWITWLVTFGRTQLVYAPYAKFEDEIKQSQSGCLVSIDKSKYINGTLSVELCCNLESCDFEQLAQTGKIESPCRARYHKVTSFAVDDFWMVNSDNTHLEYVMSAYTQCAFAISRALIISTFVLGILNLIQ